jgi:hypothetical protein
LIGLRSRKTGGVKQYKESQTAVVRPAHTPEEVAAILRLHPVYCRRLFTLGQIPGAIRLGRVWRLPAAALDRILETGLKTGGAAR